MLESIIKSIKKSILVVGLYAVTTGCGGNTFGGSMSRDASSDAASDAQAQCIDNDGDSFYANRNCGTEIDCDDNNNTIFPGALELCDYKDNNCDGQIDEGAGRTIYRDSDHDGFGDLNMTAVACLDLKNPKGPEGYVYNPDDCNDSNRDIHPEALELCDNIDQNCDGRVDNDLTRLTDCPIPTRPYTQECVAGGWQNVNIESCPECLDGTREESCCGYDGLGTKQRFCDIGGVWFDSGSCSIDNWINVSNNSARDFQPSIDGDELIFTSNRVGNLPQVYSVNTVGVDPRTPISLSGSLAAATGIDCGPCGCRWYLHSCSNGSLSEEGEVALECTWYDEACLDDFFPDRLHVLDTTINGSLIGHTPSIGEGAVVVESAGTIKVYNSTSGALLENFGVGQEYPDISSNYVAFTSIRDTDGLQKVYLGNIDTPEEPPLKISGYGVGQNGYRPTIHGNDVVFVSERGTGKQLYHYDRETESLEQITNCDDNYEPSVYGGRVAFTSERDGNKEVYVCNLRETSDCCADAVNISSNSAEDYSPSISTCKVAYVSDWAGNEEILVYDLCEGGCRE